MGFNISCKLSPIDNLHEMSKPISWENKKNIISLSSAEFVQRVLCVNQFQEQRTALTIKSYPVCFKNWLSFRMKSKFILIVSAFCIRTLSRPEHTWLTRLPQTVIHYKLFITLLLGSKAKMVLASCIPTKNKHVASQQKCIDYIEKWP